jgi:hypothetical protein
LKVNNHMISLARSFATSSWEYFRCIKHFPLHLLI